MDFRVSTWIWVLLAVITLLAFFLRLYHIESVPISLNRDETSMGYDAYSLLKTGRDQFGAFLPLTLRSADDYKPALYTYAAIPSVAVFGLRPLAVRLPSVLFGVGTVVMTFFLAMSLWRPQGDQSRNKRDSGQAGMTVKITPYLAALFVAISPWHIQFSRGAFEANAALFFVTGGVTLFLWVCPFRGKRDYSGKRAARARPESNWLRLRFRTSRNDKLLFLSGLFFGLSLLTYHAARVVTPALVALLLLLPFWRPARLASESVAGRPKGGQNRYRIDSGQAGVTMNQDSGQDSGQARMTGVAGVTGGVFRITAIFLLPIILSTLLILPSMFSPAAQVRFRALSIFNQEKFILKSVGDLAVDARQGEFFWGRIFHNRRLIPLQYEAMQQLVGNYFRHLNPADLVFGRGGPRLQQMNHAPGFGVVYWWEAVFAVVGMLVILSKSLLSFWRPARLASESVAGRPKGGQNRYRIDSGQAGVTMNRDSGQAGVTMNRDSGQAGVTMNRDSGQAGVTMNRDSGQAGVTTTQARSIQLLLIPWLLIGFVPAAVTYDIPSYVRSILVLPTIQILAAIGVVAGGSFLWQHARKLAIASIGVLIVVIVWNVGLFLHQYFVHMNDHEAEDWRYGRKEVAVKAWGLRDQYERIVVSTRLDDPHVYFLFYLGIDPAAYLDAGGTRGGGWTAQENTLENIAFHRLPEQGAFLDDAEEGVLYIGLAKEFPVIRPLSEFELTQLRERGGSYLSVVDAVVFPDGEPGILLVEKKSANLASEE